MLAPNFDIAEGVLFYTLRPVDCVAGFDVALRYWATLVVPNGHPVVESSTARRNRRHPSEAGLFLDDIGDIHS